MKEYFEIIISRHDDEERYVVECDDIPLELYSSSSWIKCLDYIHDNYRCILERWELLKIREKENVHQCIDPEMRYCQGCKYGRINFPYMTETVCFLGFDKEETEK